MVTGAYGKPGQFILDLAQPGRILDLQLAGLEQIHRTGRIIFGGQDLGELHGSLHLQQLVEAPQPQVGRTLGLDACLFHIITFIGNAG